MKKNTNTNASSGMLSKCESKIGPKHGLGSKDISEKMASGSKAGMTCTLSPTFIKTSLINGTKAIVVMKMNGNEIE